MVDCGNLRCFQERRSIKKELQSWSKKIPLVVGLETIAEHVGSKRKVRKLFEPFNCLENEAAQDWEPEENCFYCKDRLQLLFEALEKTDSKGGACILRDHPSLRHLGEILPFCPQFYTSNFGRDILSDIKNSQNEPEAPPPPPPPPVVQEPPPPVASAAAVATTVVTSKSVADLKVPFPSGTSGKQKKEMTSSDKKAYTDTDLTAALSEIRNGKLGTRRAASLYGIPRSTLRNKVCKMDPDDLNLTSVLTEEEDGSSNDSQPVPHQQQVSPGPQSSGSRSATKDLHDLQSPLKQLSLQQPVNTQPLMLSDLLQFSTLQYLAPFAMPYIMQTDLMPLFQDTEWEKKLQTIRHKHNLTGLPMHDEYSEKAHKHKFKPYQYELIKKLTRERLELEKKASNLQEHEGETLSHTHSLFLRGLDHSSPLGTIHHLPQADTSSYDTHSAILKALNMDPASAGRSKTADVNLPSKLVIPSYSSRENDRSETIAKQALHDIDKRPYDALFKYENTRIGDTLKDIIVKTISEKVRCKLESTDFTSLVGDKEKQKAKETILSAFTIPDTGSPPKKIKREPTDSSSNKSSNNNNNGSSSSNSSSTPPKKTRPKRGQYRKYNSQLLTEAVKAVQRGEMSVHRAGSYYGVPHSTLEYKVKERHLLRQKKIKEQQEQKRKEAEESKKNSEVSQLSKHALDKGKSGSCPTKAASEALGLSPPKSFPGPSWLPPFVSPTPFDNAAALGLFGSGFALSTPASELLRKLQHKVQS